MTIPQEVRRLRLAAEHLTRCLLALDGHVYLRKLNGWAPRDILAHLVGWNRAVIRGSEELRRGELPFYDVDPGEGYSKVNVAFVSEYSSTDRKALLAELEASIEELADYLLALDPDDWGRTWGVRHGEELLTIRDTVDELTEDYEHHVALIDRWVKEKRHERDPRPGS